MAIGALTESSIGRSILGGRKALRKDLVFPFVSFFFSGFKNEW